MIIRRTSNQGVKETTFICEKDADTDLLIEFEIIAQYLEISDKRVIEAQQRMHYAMGELSEIKNSWAFKTFQMIEKWITKKEKY
jgi:hypothetical protein